jgi:hypothetical protein
MPASDPHNGERAAHAPGVVVGHGVAIDLGRVQVEEDVIEHAEGAAARCFIRA